MLRAERQNDPMSKITNDGLTRSGTGCFIDAYDISGRQRVNISFSWCLFIRRMSLPVWQISASGEKVYHDAYTLQQVESANVADFNYVAGMVPFLLNHIIDVRLQSDVVLDSHRHSHFILLPC